MKVAAKREIAALALVTLPAAIWLSAEPQAFYPPKVVIGLCYFSLFIVLGMELRGIWKQATEQASKDKAPKDNDKTGRPMKYPIAIEAGSDTTAWGVAVPDLPGCFSAGDTLDEAYENAKEAIAAWINAALDDGQPIPKAKALAVHARNKEFKGWQWAIVELDMDQFDDKVERINISIPKRVLNQIDRFVSTHSSDKNRSDFLARAALEVIYQSSQGDDLRPRKRA